MHMLNIAGAVRNIPSGWRWVAATLTVCLLLLRGKSTDNCLANSTVCWLGFTGGANLYASLRISFWVAMEAQNLYKSIAFL